MIYVGGIRTSTLLVALLFALAGLLPGVRWRAGVAALAWLLGFEAAWQLTTALTHHGAPADVVSRGLNLVTVGGGWAAAAWLAGIRPNRVLVLATAGLWLLWMASGFHSNLHGGAINVGAEVLNEAAKTAWGLAYLLPLGQPLHRPLAHGGRVGLVGVAHVAVAAGHEDV